MRASLLGIALALIQLSAPAHGAEDTLTLGLEDSRQFARQALVAGEAELAGQIALALLEADPEDVDALTLLAGAELRLGQYAAALETARRAYRLSDPGPLRYEAARIAAEASYGLGRPGRAQLWVRRAAEAAPRDDLKEAAAGLYRRIGAERRVTTDLRFHVAPSSNVNRGSSADVLVIDGVPTPFVLSEDARALSGYEISAAGGLRYRLQATPTSRTDVGFDLSATTYVLSDEARAVAPDVSGSDYSFARAEVSLTHLFAAEAGAAPWKIEAAAGSLWYGGDRLGGYGRLGLGKSLRFSDRLGATVEATYEAHWRDTSAGSTVVGLETELARQAGNGDLIGLGFTANTVGSSDRNLESDGISLALDWTRAAPVFGEVTMSAGVSATYRDFPVFFSNIFNRTGRQDLTLGSQVEFTFPEAGAYGFAPTLTLRASDTNSNISRYDQTNYGVAFGIRSVF